LLRKAWGPAPRPRRRAEVQTRAEPQPKQECKVTLRLDIDAEAPDDFPSDVVDVVNANAKTLKFEQSGFS
jgi:hypothetical protein